MFRRLHEGTLSLARRPYLGLALLACACGSGAGNNQSASLPPAAGPASDPARSGPDPLAPFEVSLSVESGRCRASVRGETVDAERLLARAVDALRASIERQGGVDRVDALPPVSVRGGDVPWRCAAAAIWQTQRAGFAQVRFEAVPGATAIAFDLPVEVDAPPPPIAPAINRIALAADGSFGWNGTPVTPEQLVERLRAAETVIPTPQLELDPAATTRLEAVVSLLGLIRGAGIVLAGSQGDTALLGSGPPEEPGPAMDLPPPVVDAGVLPSVGFVGLERYAGELK